MLKFVLGFVLGVAVATVGVSGMVKALDGLIKQAQNLVVEVSQ